MAEKPDDLNLPAAVVKRLVKESLPDGVNVSKEARSAIGRAASVFVLYSATCANNYTMSAKRKTLTSADVFEAMNEMGFDQFIEPMKSCLTEYKKNLQNKKEAKKVKSNLAAEADINAGGDSVPAKKRKEEIVKDTEKTIAEEEEEETASMDAIIEIDD